MVADYLGSTELRCTSPLSDETRASSSLSLDFSDSNGFSVLGPTLLPADAFIDGVLQRNAVVLKNEASVLISAPLALEHARVFEAAFDLWIGGGFSTAGWNAIGDCVSFCIGDLSISPTIEHGVVDRLCISFLANANAIFITLDAELVASGGPVVRLPVHAPDVALEGQAVRQGDGEDDRRGGQPSCRGSKA